MEKNLFPIPKPCNMFAIQAISVTVGEGDSLDVTWTITTGG